MLDTFETLVVDDGERAATFDAVAAAAGVSKGGLLYHFPTREALVDGLVDRLTALLDDDVATMTSAPEGVVDYFVRTSSPAAIPADDPLDRCITAVSNLASSGRHPRALEALTAMQSRWHQVVLDAVGDPAVARVVSLVSDGLYFTPRPFSPVDSGGDPRHDTSIDDVIAVLQRLVPRS
jgi:AcrR family transcriptional regulator